MTFFYDACECTTEKEGGSEGKENIFYHPVTPSPHHPIILTSSFLQPYVVHAQFVLPNHLGVETS